MKLFTLAIITWCLFVAPSCFALDDGNKIDKLTSVQADFVQEKHLKILAKPIISRGTFSFQSPQSLRWEYRTPVPSLLLMHGDKVRKFVKKDGDLKEEKGARFDFMQVVMGEIGNWLDGRFTENEMFNVTFNGDKSVQLIPKKEALASLISKIELSMAEEKGLLDAVKIYEDSSSYTLITFNNRILNQEIPANQFTQR